MGTLCSCTLAHNYSIPISGPFITSVMTSSHCFGVSSPHWLIFFQHGNYYKLFHIRFCFILLLFAFTAKPLSKSKRSHKGFTITFSQQWCLAPRAHFSNTNIVLKVLTIHQSHKDARITLLSNPQVWHIYSISYSEKIHSFICQANISMLDLRKTNLLCWSIK